MTNKPRKFLPKFETQTSSVIDGVGQSGERSFTQANWARQQDNKTATVPSNLDEHLDSPSLEQLLFDGESGDDFDIDGLMGSDIGLHDLKGLGGASRALPKSPSDFADNEFDKILSEVDGMGENTFSSELTTGFEPEMTPSVEISDEQREEIYASGYMQGSLDQKTVMDKRLAELQEVIESLKVATSTPAQLSKEITESIGGFIKELSRSLLSDVRETMLKEMVESRVQEFVSSVRGWEMTTSVYCSPSDYAKLAEIFKLTEDQEHDVIAPPPSFEVGNVLYALDAEQSEGRFRLEVEREGGSNIEALMDIDAHLGEIAEIMNEAIS